MPRRSRKELRADEEMLGGQARRGAHCRLANSILTHACETKGVLVKIQTQSKQNRSSVARRWRQAGRDRLSVSCDL